MTSEGSTEEEKLADKKAEEKRQLIKELVNDHLEASKQRGDNYPFGEEPTEEERQKFRDKIESRTPFIQAELARHAEIEAAKTQLKEPHFRDTVRTLMGTRIKAPKNPSDPNKYFIPDRAMRPSEDVGETPTGTTSVYHLLGEVEQLLIDSIATYPNVKGMQRALSQIHELREVSLKNAIYAYQTRDGKPHDRHQLRVMISRPNCLELGPSAYKDKIEKALKIATAIIPTISFEKKDDLFLSEKVVDFEQFKQDLLDGISEAEITWKTLFAEFKVADEAYAKNESGTSKDSQNKSGTQLR